MKPPSICLSARTRRLLNACIKAISVLMTVLCVFYLVMVVYSLYRHKFLLHDLVISLFDDLYKNLVCVGVLLTLLSVMGFKLNVNLKNQPTNHSVPRTHHVWVGLSLLALLATAACSSLIARVETVVEAEIGPRLKHGMSRYTDSPPWGLAMNRVQSFLHCCGVHGPSDWYNTAWIPMDMLSGHNVDNKLVQPTGRVLVPLVPSSCCRSPSAACGHRAWLEDKTKAWADIKPADSTLLYTTGCEEAIRFTLTRDLLILKTILLIVVILQAMLVLAGRFLYSSTLNSVLLGRPQGSAPGWLIGPRLFSKKRRYGYLQDYDQRCQQIKTEESQNLCSKKVHCWKCLAKMRCRKSEKEASTDGTVGSEGKKRFQSPCMKKLNPTKCVTKLKESCSKRFKRKKNKEGEYTPVDTDTALDSDFSPERERKKSNYDQRIMFLEMDRKPQDKSGRKSPDRIRTGGDKNNEHRTSGAGGTTLRRKLSENLIDFEDVYQENHKQLDIFETGVNQMSPFKEKNEFPAARNMTETVNMYEARKQVSAVVQDFYKRRALFENVTKSTSPTDRAETAITTNHPSTINSLTLLELEGVGSAKSISTRDTLGTERTVLSSIKNQTKRPVVLRNYPPLSPLD